MSDQFYVVIHEIGSRAHGEPLVEVFGVWTREDEARNWAKGYFLNRDKWRVSPLVFANPITDSEPHQATDYSVEDTDVKVRNPRKA